MQSFGKLGEDNAAAFLIKNGYEILQRNYRFKKSEIDLICSRNKLMVFVEVKTRSSIAFGNPESFVSQNQQEAIIRAAEAYMLENRWEGDIRFDIIAIYKRGKEEELVHFEDAFY